MDDVLLGLADSLIQLGVQGVQATGYLIGRLNDLVLVLGGVALDDVLAQCAQRARTSAWSSSNS